MAGANLLDLAITGQKTNDIRLLGGLVPGLRKIWPVTGTAMHLFNGAALGSVYSLTQHGLPGPAWARGVVFAQVENLVLYPILFVTDRIHPDIERGNLGRYLNPGTFVLEALRHAVYGAVLGAAYDALTRQTRRS
jgi:hypothetical protein